MTESFEALLEESLAQKNLRPGTIVTGTIMEIRDDTVVVNAGLKSEGIVPIAQFKNLKGELEVEVGDEVQVALDTLEDGFGETRLSRDKAKRALVWDKLESAFEDDETVEGKISGKVKGGFTVDIEDIRAFLPGSLVDVRPVRDPAYLEGKDLEFKIIKLDRKRNNIVVSRRAVVESEFSAEREQLLERLEEGAIVTGVVKNLTDYGAFLDLGGIDGLLHITDMAWKRVHHPSEVVEDPGRVHRTGIGLGVELGGIDVTARAHHLHRTGRRGHKRGDTVGQRLHRPGALVDEAAAGPAERLAQYRIGQRRLGLLQRGLDRQLAVRLERGLDGQLLRADDAQQNGGQARRQVAKLE